MIKDNRRFLPIVFFFIALLLTTLSVFLLILPESSLPYIPLSQDIIAGMIMLLLSIGIFVLPAAGVIFAILGVFKYKSPLLAIFEIVLNVAIPVVVLSFEMF